MIIREVSDKEKKQWDQFVEKNPTGSFLHSWSWTEFIETQKKIWRFVIEEESQWQVVLFLVKTEMQLGMCTLYSPKGPIIDSSLPVTRYSLLLKKIIEKVDQLAKQEKALNFEMDPHSNDENWLKIFDQLGFQKTKNDMQPRHTLILDIQKKETDLLKEMHQKTRYNLRLAEKKGVKVLVDNKMFKEFYELLKKTNQRQKVVTHSQKYYEQLLSCPLAKLYLARYNGQIIAANIMVFWNDNAVYLFGASDYEFRNIMAPYLLQWQAIQDARKAGLKFYDFWGAAPEGAKGQQAKWYGFTRFKKGFSPKAELTEYLGTYEKVYQPVKLGFYRFIRKIYRLK